MANVLLGETIMETFSPSQESPASSQRPSSRPATMTETIDLSKGGDMVVTDKITAVESKKMNLLPYIIGGVVLYFIMSKKLFKK